MKNILDKTVMGDDWIRDDFDPDNPRTCSCGALQEVRNTTSGTNGYTQHDGFICINCIRQKQVELYGDVEEGTIWKNIHSNFILKVDHIEKDSQYRMFDKVWCIVLEGKDFFSFEKEFKPNYWKAMDKKPRIFEYRSCLLDFESYKKIN